MLFDVQVSTQEHQYLYSIYKHRVGINSFYIYIYIYVYISSKPSTELLQQNIQLLSLLKKQNLLLLSICLLQNHFRCRNFL